MLKRELTAIMAQQHKELKVKDVDVMTRLVFDIMAESLTNGNEIEIRGFGSFRIRNYSERAARNPGTGQFVELGPRRGILFRLGQEMRDRLNGEKIE
jgi:integration host factor subunit beta